MKAKAKSKSSIKKSKQSTKKNLFDALSASYGLSRPEQIQMRIMWRNIQALIRASFGDGEKNRKVMQVFDRQWKICEEEQNRLATKALQDESPTM